MRARVRVRVSACPCSCSCLCSRECPCPHVRVRARASTSACPSPFPRPCLCLCLRRRRDSVCVRSCACAARPRAPGTWGVPRPFPPQALEEVARDPPGGAASWLSGSARSERRRHCGQRPPRFNDLKRRRCCHKRTIGQAARRRSRKPKIGSSNLPLSWIHQNHNLLFCCVRGRTAVCFRRLRFLFLRVRVAARVT